VQQNAKGEFLNEYKLLFSNPKAAAATVAFIACFFEVSKRDKKRLGNIIA
jgi:hypothetical protein